MSLVAIAENDPEDRKLLVQSLPGKWPSDSIVEFKSEKEVAEFLTQLTQQPKSAKLPDLFIIDLNMESADSGHRLVELIRKNDLTESRPIVICSSSSRKKDIRKSYENGANSFVAKEEKREEKKKQFKKMFSYWLRVSTLPE